MAKRDIRLDIDPILRKKCKEVKDINERIITILDDMSETMYDASGVGLAAPQIGILRRMVVIDIGEQGNGLIELINPTIIEVSGEQTGDEACLSLPGRIGTVTRPTYCKVKALDRNADEIIVEGEGLMARALCHEIDHLDGILYSDKTVDGILRDVNTEEE